MIFPQYGSISEAIAEHTPGAAVASGSALVREALLWAGYFDGVKAYMVGHFGPTDALGLWVLMGLTLANYALLYFACLAFSCFLIPRAGFVRAGMAPRSRGQVFVIAAITSSFICFFYVPLLAGLESFVSRSPWPAHVRTTVHATITPVVEVLLAELIDSEYYEFGTRKEIAKAREEVAPVVTLANERLRQKVDTVFQQLEGEPVDAYLDWYYSPMAEYGRFLALFKGIGSLDNLFAERLREVFQQHGGYAAIIEAVDEFMSAGEEAKRAYEQRVDDILKRNRMSRERLQHIQIEVKWNGWLEDILQPPLHQDYVPAADRLFGVTIGAVGVAGGVGSIMAKKITAKVLARPALKLAAKAVTKPFLNRVVGSALTSAGALSIVPGLGTAAGAAAGAAVGIGVGFLLDGAAIKVEEALSRDEHRSEIVASVRQAHREFKDRYLDSPVQPIAEGR